MKRTSPPAPPLSLFFSGWFERDGPAPMHVLRGSFVLFVAMLAGVGTWFVEVRRVFGLAPDVERWIMTALAAILIPAVASDYARAIKRLWSVPA